MSDEHDIVSGTQQLCWFMQSNLVITISEAASYEMHNCAFQNLASFPGTRKVAWERVYSKL